MAALNPEIIKDTKSLISLYQKNNRFKLAFDKIVANNINATYHGRPVKLYVEVLKNVTSKYKQEYSQVRKIVLHDTDGKVGELFNKVNPNTDFNLLDQAYNAALKGKNIINEKNFKEKEIEEINKTEEKFKNDKGFIDNKGKREEYQTKIEAGLLLKEDEIVPGESPENKKSYNPASQEERDRLKVALLPKDEVPKNVLISPSGQALAKPFREPEKPSVNILVGPSGYSAPSTSLPNIPNPSGLRNFASGSKNLFRGGAKAGGVVAKGAGRAAGTAIKVGAGAAAKLGASALLGAATGGISLVIGLLTSGDELKKLFKLIFWIVIGLIAFIVVMFVFQRGEKMNSLLPPYDIPTMGSVVGNGSCPTQAFIDQNRKATPETCQYLNPPINIFGDLTTTQINSYISKYWKQSGLNESDFTAKTNTIAERSRASGLNPVIFLGYWKSESAFKESFGCKNTPLDFNSQLECAVGLTAGASRVMQCASPKSPYREQGCRDIKGIIMDHPDIYDKSLFNFDFSKTSFSLADEPNPIRTFDALAEGHGPRSPNLSLSEGVTNNNCIHTYNDLLEVILATNTCTQPSLTPPPSLTCSGTLTTFDATKKLLPLPNDKPVCARTQTQTCGRPGFCVKPTKIVLHTTWSTLNGILTYDYFASGASGYGTGTHFIIDKDGTALQLVELYQDKIEVAWTVAGYQDHISFELVSNSNYESKDQVPSAQYQKTLSLVKALMTQYNIPKGDLEYTWKTPSNNPVSGLSGIFGHYQLNPETKTDPGSGFLRDLRVDLK